MLDISEETLVSLKDAAEDFGGVSIPYETVRKYAYRGVRGVKLETVFINHRLTSREAIRRFIDHRQGEELAVEKPKPKKMTQEHVRQTLQRYGIVK